MEVSWLPDSSGIVTMVIYPEFGIGIDVEGKDGWAAIFKAAAPGEPASSGDNFSSLSVDPSGNIYFLKHTSVIPEEGKDTVLYRCGLEGRALSCRERFRGREIGQYEALAPGALIYNGLYEKCINRVVPGQKDPECIAGLKAPAGAYTDMALIGASPDGRSLAFGRTTRSANGFRYDLFIKSLDGPPAFKGVEWRPSAVTSTSKKEQAREPEKKEAPIIIQPPPKPFGKEKLVAYDIGPQTFLEGWCGDGALIIVGADGLKMLDIKTGAWSFIQNGIGGGCTKDGKWLFYFDKESFRPDGGRVVGKYDIESMPAQGYVIDLVRHEVATGKRDIFAVVRDDYEMKDRVSPDGKKVFLGNRVNIRTDVPEPELEDLWYSNEWENTSDPQWLSDSSGIVVKIQDGNYNSDIGIEVFGEKGWSKVFPWDEGKGKIIELKTGKENDLFLLTSRGLREEGREKYRKAIYRCEIKNRELDCEAIFNETYDDYTFDKFGTLPDGGFMIMKKHMLLFLYPPNAFFLITKDAGRFEVSPDGKKVAFERTRDKKGKDYHSLYIIEIGQ